MTKVITTCLLGAGIMTAAATLPKSQAHEGHGGHDHDTTQQTEPQVPSSRVIKTPPPFETLDNDSPPSMPGSKLQQPKQNRSDPAARRPELLSPRAEGGDIRRFPSAAPKTFRRDFGNDYYPESRSPDDFAHGRSVPPTEDFACPLGERDAYLGDHPSVRGFAEPSTLGERCPYEVQWLDDSSHDVRRRHPSYRSSYDLNRYQHDDRRFRDYHGEYDCPNSGSEYPDF